MFNAVLINPWVCDFTYHNLWEKPAGILSVASYLIKHGVSSVSFIDCVDERLKKVNELERGSGKFNGVVIEKPRSLMYIPRNYNRFGISQEDMIRKMSLIKGVLDEKLPTVVLITCMMTYWYNGAFDVARAIKLHFPEMKIVIGGIYARLLPQHARDSELFDFVEESGDRRVIFENLLKVCGIKNAPENKSPKTSLHYFKNIESNKKYALTNPAFHYSNLSLANLSFKPQFFVNVDVTPADRLECQVRGPEKFEDDGDASPLYELMPELNNSAALITSTGCPYSCSYCASEYLYGGFTPRRMEIIHGDLAYFKKILKVDNVAFYDDALLYKKEENFYRLAELIIKSDFKFRFHLPNAVHAAMIDDKCAEVMKEIGVSTIRLGYEFYYSAAQRATGGKIGNEALKSAIASLLKAGFKRDDIGVYILFGHPGTPIDDIYKGADFVLRSGAVPHLSLYSPIPQTPDGEAVFRERHEFLDEPLKQNKSIFFELYGKITFQEYYKIKSYIQAQLK